MVTKDELLKDISTNKDYKHLCRTMAHELSDDLFQEMVLIILQYPAEKIEQIKYPRCFIVKILSNMWNSSTSPFYYKYRKRNSYATTENIPFYEEGSDKWKDTALKKIEQELNGMYWYDRELFKLYMEKGSTRKVQKEIGIHYVSVHNTVHRVKQKLRERFEKDITGDAG